MEAVLYICHGSRVKEAVEQAVSFIESCKSEISAPIQEVGFLELAEPSIEEAFRSCIERGAKKITAVPVLLLAAAHAKEDIPKELSRLKELFPDVDVKLAQPFGVHSGLINILIERIKETEQEITDDSIVLLVGRGSSDPDVKVDLGKIAEMLKQSLRIKRVDTCYMAAASPSFEEGMKIAIESGAKRIFVIPYLLFTGILMKKIEKTIKTIHQNPQQKVILCNYLGYHPILKNILQARITEADFNERG